MSSTNKYVVAFARISVDKQDGIIMHGVFFGGIGDTFIEATQIARECVNNIRGGAIIPKILQMSNDENIIDVLYNAADKFEQITKNMLEVHEHLKSK